MKAQVTLAHVPEEILERILALVLVQSAELSIRPPWHPYQTPPAAGHAAVISPLLVSRTWLRIATPIHYRHPVLRTPRHVELLLRALRYTPALAQCIRSLHVQATAPALRELVPLCSSLDTLDVTVDNADAFVPQGQPEAEAEKARERAVREFCDAFVKTRAIRHLVIRKNAYLTQAHAIYIFEQLSNAIAHWRRLETVNVAFRLSPSPAASALVQALAVAPRLQTVYTQLPAVWNTTLLDIAQNPVLARLVLSPAPDLAGAQLFLAEAKRHPRLIDLIRAGHPAPAVSPYGRQPHGPHAQQYPTASIRARAGSAAVPARPPMDVPTWGYERDVPPPACPPAHARRPVQGHHGGPGSFVGPSAYAHGPVPPSAYPAYPAGAQYHQSQQPHQHHARAVGNHPGQYYAYGTNHYQASAAARMQEQQEQPAYIAGQPRRAGPGTRRMTAS